MEKTEETQEEVIITNRDLLLPYFLPYAAYVGLASISPDWLPMQWNYLARIVVVPILLIWGWRWYVSLTGPMNRWGSVLAGIVGGLAGTVLWVALLQPFVEPFGGDPWTPAEFLLRILAASLIVPIFEELLLRGMIFRMALQWDQARKAGREDPVGVALDGAAIDEVKPGAWSFLAILISTVAFTVGHNVPEWPASMGYGALMCGLWILRKDLLSCIVAHGVTNFTLALYVIHTGKWGLW